MRFHRSDSNPENQRTAGSVEPEAGTAAQRPCEPAFGTDLGQVDAQLCTPVNRYLSLQISVYHPKAQTVVVLTLACSVRPI